jgi:hypothetical protein
VITHTGLVMMLPLVHAQCAVICARENLTGSMMIIIPKTSAANAELPGMAGKRHDNAPY